MSKAKKKRYTIGDTKQINLRLPPDLLDWVNDTAAEYALARDQFLRMILRGTRASMQEAAKEGTNQARLFDRLEKSVADAVERATVDALSGLHKPRKGAK